MEKQEKTICPSCNGFGFIVPFPSGHLARTSFENLKKICTCYSCQGEGVLQRNITWEKQGKFLRWFRTEKLNLGLRQACRKFDLDPANLSKMERGIIKPQPPWKLFTE